jgi:hypothetical protein
MIVQMFKFKSRLPDEEVRRVMRERAPRFREQKGLLQKFYGYEESTKMHTGIYIWDSTDFMRAFLETELARSIPSAYQVEAPPRVEVFELIFRLREMATASKSAAA